MSSPYWSEIIRDFDKAFEDGDDYDVIIKVGEDSDIKELRAHSFVLRTRCPYFKRAFSDDWEERDDNKNFILTKPNISFNIFQLILRYLYTGIVDYDQYDRNVLLQLLVAADELELCELIEHIQEYLFENLELLYKDPVTALQIIYQNEPLGRLKDYCLEVISSEPMILFASENFPSIEKQIIAMVLERDDLNMEEADIWDSLLRWIFVRNLNIGNDDFTWSIEDSANVKQIIQEFTPLIRFHNISKEDFYLKVFPYKCLLPQDLLGDILRYHIAPNSVPTLSFKPSRIRRMSVLMIDDVFRLFAKWIDKKDDDYTQENMPYIFDLLLRGTRDGFDPAKFHRLCDDKGATISFARVKNSKQIIGGYNPINWGTNGSYANTSNKSFLFKITDSSDLSTAQVSRCNGSNGVYCHRDYGPTFGGGHDLRAQRDTWSANNGNTYTNINIPTSFTVDEYEVFQVKKKE